MRVPMWQIRTAESWGYLTGSWREATHYCSVFLYILEKVNQECYIDVFFIY